MGTFRSKERSMNPEASKKLITLNHEFQKVLRQIVDGESVDEKKLASPGVGT